MTPQRKNPSIAAIKLEFINVIVPNTTLEAVFAEQGGFEFFKQSYGAMRDMVWYDDHICRVDGSLSQIFPDAVIDPQTQMEHGALCVKEVPGRHGRCCVEYVVVPSWRLAKIGIYPCGNITGVFLNRPEYR